LLLNALSVSTGDSFHLPNELALLQGLTAAFQRADAENLSVLLKSAFTAWGGRDLIGATPSDVLILCLAMRDGLNADRLSSSSSSSSSVAALEVLLAETYRHSNLCAKSFCDEVWLVPICHQ
jgi:hypothetical protein